ncbi:long-chain-fatty-acid--CoA ligase 1-like isoform X2 [Amphiura filiformis]|uniref:long-chain-fatty-acid--CoA ligase 1-like isoform X2 n=1 Tax=Amphiura filiformis TaxID=82378 RepID=UPI003B2159A2
MQDFKELADDNVWIVAAGTAVVVVLGTTLYWLTHRGSKTRIMAKYDYNKQSVLLPGEERIRCSTLVNHEKGQHFIEKMYDDMNTVYDTLQRGMKQSNDGDCLGWRPGPGQPYKWMKYSEVNAKAVQFGAGLIFKGCEAVNTTNIGIYSQNRPEWTISDYGCQSYSMVAVPLYDTLGEEAMVHTVKLTDMTTIVCDNMSKVQGLLKHRSEMPTLRLIILIGTPSDEDRKLCEDGKVEIISFEGLLELGKENPTDLVLPKPDDLCTICFTSGTTGVPKGGKLTHRAFIAQIAAVHTIASPALNISIKDVHASYLPLAHVFERCMQFEVLSVGGRMGYFQGDVKLLTDDLQALQPTVFPCVPRLMNRIYDKVMSGVNSSGGVKKALFNFAYNKKKAEVLRGICRTDSIWDKIVFKKIQALLGGRVQWMVIGSAPISAEVLLFWRVVIGCNIQEGYGQTECTAACSVTLAGDNLPQGHVGPPIPCNIIKLCDVPEMNYFAKDDQGEICVKGPNVFSGYHKNEEKTKEAIDEDGWLHTGDIGVWLPNGCVKITDRKKHIFKLAQGEYVAPEKIEIVYCEEPLVAQAFVYGESLKASIIGVIVPDEEELVKYGKKEGLEGDFKQLCAKKEVKDAILKRIVQHGKKRGLKGFELVRDIHIYDDPFSVDNGLLTPTFKGKRPALKTFFASQLADMYTKLD